MGIDLNKEPMTREQIDAQKEELKRQQNRVSLTITCIDVITFSVCIILIHLIITPLPIFYLLLVSSGLVCLFKKKKLGLFLFYWILWISTISFLSLLIYLTEYRLTVLVFTFVWLVVYVLLDKKKSKITGLMAMFDFIQRAECENVLPLLCNQKVKKYRDKVVSVRRPFTYGEYQAMIK